jgi:chemotaxis protein methyltransferase CheR
MMIPAQVATPSTAQPSILQAFDLIERRIGLAAATRFQNELYPLLNSLSDGDLAGYIHKLAASRETDSTWQSFVDALMIGETYFLRDRAHFDTIRTRILPELIERRRREGRLEITIWSAGCATGEEPYSLAITLQEVLPDWRNWQIRLIGSDLSATALRSARQGVYRKWAFRHTDAEFVERYFDPTPDGLQIKPVIRDMVTFRHSNLLSGAPVGPCDLILCRNVLLYFTQEAARKAEATFNEMLAPGGWLMLGHSETLHYQRGQWLTHVFPGLPVYQKAPPRQSAHARTPAARTLAVQSAAPCNGASHDEAVRALQNEEFELAQELLEELVYADSGDAAAHTLLACVHANLSHPKDAHAHLDAALHIDPLLADAHYLRALIHIESGDVDAAGKALRATLYCQRAHPLAAFLMGNLSAQAGELIKATRYWENAHHAIINLTPESPVSTISDVTAGRLRSLVEAQLDGWQS